MARSGEKLRDSGIVDRAVTVGDTAPDLADIALRFMPRHRT